LAGKVDKGRLLEWYRVRQQVGCGKRKWSVDDIYHIVADFWKVRQADSIQHEHCQHDSLVVSK